MYRTLAFRGAGILSSNLSLAEESFHLLKPVVAPIKTKRQVIKKAILINERFDFTRIISSFGLNIKKLLFSAN